MNTYVVIMRSEVCCEIQADEVIYSDSKVLFYAKDEIGNKELLGVCDIIAVFKKESHTFMEWK
jgi:hypothetical protein